MSEEAKRKKAGSLDKSKALSDTRRMSDEVLSSLAKARAIFRKHAAEQKSEGRAKAPDAWISTCENRLVVVVHAHLGERPIIRPYEYTLGFPCGGVHEITGQGNKNEGHRKKKEAGRRSEPLRQLHMFKLG